MLRRSGFDDAGGGFAYGPPSLATYRQLYRQVLAAYGQRCAFSGEPLPADLTHEQTIVPIRPRETGGPLHVTNYVALAEAMAAAFRAGHVGVGERYEFVIDEDQIDPATIRRFNRDGRMAQPADPAYRPDPRHLAFHLARIFGGGDGHEGEGP